MTIKRITRRQLAAWMLGCAVIPSGVWANTAFTPSAVRMEARASLPRAGSVVQLPFLPPPSVQIFNALGRADAEWRYTPGNPGYLIEPDFPFAGAYARAYSTGSGSADAALIAGTSANARAVADAAGAARASIRLEWNLKVVLNPFAGVGQLGLPTYLQLLERFGCNSQGLCDIVPLDTDFQHLTTGRFAHSTQPSHTGIASFSETLTITNGLVPDAPNFRKTELAGGATYTVRMASQPSRMEGVLTRSGGWTEADFTDFAAVPARQLNLYPGNNPRAGTDDPNGPMAGTALTALRQTSLTTFFYMDVIPELHPTYALPQADFSVTLEQVATAGFSGNYGWGTIAADFDNTARTVISRIVDPTGALTIDASMLQINVTPVPEPSTWAMLMAGLALLASRVRRASHRSGLGRTDRMPSGLA